MLRLMACSSLALLGSACAQIGLKSLAVPSYSAVHDREAVEFYRKAPPIDGSFGEGLTTKDMEADGRLVGLSVSGGGARATAFTLGVLSELQLVDTSDASNALDRIDFISSNSGGSWGVAAYLLDRSANAKADYKLADRVREWMIPTFVKMSKGRVPCWNSAMGEHLGPRTFGDVYSPGKGPELPRAYFNASLLPAHAPFVFNDRFIAYYQVKRFGACAGDWMPETRTLANLRLAYAAATSGTVPGFYYAYAETGLCEAAETRAASFCHGREKGRRSFLRLADGGLYDNMAYKTAYEMMLSQRTSPRITKRAMILVNSNPTTDFKTVPEGDTRKNFLVTTATIGWLANQDSTFERLYKGMFQELGGPEPVLLDFYSTARFGRDAPSEGDRLKLLDDLNELAYFAAHNVHCFNGDELVRVKRRKLRWRAPLAESLGELARKGGDCLSENFYRVGTLHKTTYLADEELFTILWQLGRLSVRMNQPKIADALN